ncbi:hypothetical protein AURDEDRAFT_177091 [Auricularia subglabra TFB-10046 SS5]|uniref:Uncharacterized protein n=1 Tax=Auricularia subglabra (strain TFB-10046 / SS5) TaxID=717982 RepID=J0CU30_AURST|nr:hypothetical protein AURDEDRAFT_177091 [Auricularia subglabra TFB-10046 SS5]
MAFLGFLTHSAIIDSLSLYRPPAITHPVFAVYPPENSTAHQVMSQVQPDASEPEAFPYFDNDPELNERVHRMHRYSDNNSLTYSVTCVPGSVQVMHVRQLAPFTPNFKLLSHKLPLSPVQAPITIWMVGRTARAPFRTNSDTMVSLDFVPLCQSAHSTAHALLWFFSSHGVYERDPNPAPPLVLTRPRNVGATFTNIIEEIPLWDATRRLLSPRAHMPRYDFTSHDPVPVILDPSLILGSPGSVPSFDARLRLENPRDLMSKVSVNPGDLVLLETNFARYRGNALTADGVLSSWMPVFQAKNLSLLRRNTN